MIIIRSLRADDIPAVKRVIYTVAYSIFGGYDSLEDSIRAMEHEGELADLDRAQAEYADRGGTFLVAVDGDQVIGSGAIRGLDDVTAEVKRLWLLEGFHGRGIGWQLMRRLIEFASRKGYRRLVLQTSPKQQRALTFYRRLGFREIPTYNEDRDEISMELPLDGTIPGLGRHKVEKGKSDEPA